MNEDELPTERNFPARDVEMAKRVAQENLRQILFDNVWCERMIPSEAEEFADANCIVLGDAEASMPIESPRWSLAQAVLWVAWRDPERVHEQWRRLYVWSGDLWRDPPGEHQVETFEQAEAHLWAALEAGRVHAAGLPGHEPRPVQIEPLDWSNLVWMPDKTRLSVRWFGQPDPAYRVVEVRSTEMLAVWPAPGMQVPGAGDEVVEKPEDVHPRRRDKGGAIPQYDEVEFLIEAFRIVYDGSRVLTSQADLNRRATDAYAAMKGFPAGKPSLEWGRENIRRLWVGLGIERPKRSQ